MGGTLARSLSNCGEKELAVVDAELPDPAGERYDEAGMAAVNL